MAQIRKRAPSQYQARVRLLGFPEATKTFTSKTEATAWAASVEALSRQGHGDSFNEANKLTLFDAPTRYSVEVTPHKKGAAHDMAYIKRWKLNLMAALSIAEIRGAVLARQRDSRLAVGKSGNTVRLPLAFLSHLYEVARKNWGLESLVNPAKAIRKPKVAAGCRGVKFPLAFQSREFLFIDKD